MIYALNPVSVKVFNSLPYTLRNVMVKQMKYIHHIVTARNPRAVITSAFRCPTYNRRLSGAKGNSGHQYGLCLDYRLSSMKPFDDPRLKIITEKDHYHVELREDL